MDWLRDLERSNVKRELYGTADVLLRGHLHETEVESVESVTGSAVGLAAGAAYQTRRWPNRAMFVVATPDALRVQPIRYEDDPELWTIDPSVFPREAGSGYVREFRLTRASEPSATPPSSDHLPRRTRTNITARGDVPLVGREGVLAELGAAFSDASAGRVVLVHGFPGVGKSEVAREYARRNLGRYPGGAYLLDFTGANGPVELARLGANHLGLTYPSDLSIEDQCDRTITSIGDRPTLLIYDNASPTGPIDRLLPAAGAMCHVLVTSVTSRIVEDWPSVEVTPLSREESLELIAAVAGAATAEGPVGHQLESLSGGIAVQLLPASRAVAYELRRGRPVVLRPGLEAATTGSFDLIYGLLDRPVRLVLHAASFLSVERFERAELRRQIIEAWGWGERDLDEHLDACADLHLLEGAEDLRMHRLLADYLTSRAVAADDSTDVARMRHAQFQRFVDCGRAVTETPADAETAGRLLVFPADPATWMNAGVLPTSADGTTAALGLLEVGHFEQARPWFERAVTRAEQGDIDGRVDHESLSASLHLVGYCYTNTGQFDKARPWFERAVTEAEQGDIDGRVDHESLGTSLHQVGDCYTSIGQFDKARPWFERAVTEAEQGDIDGRVDHESLGRSVNLVGYCYSSTGQFDKARPWYERAVAEAEQGDIHGRVDHASLGRSLHQVGYCYTNIGQFDKARASLERAVTEKEHGDIHGRVDHESLGRSLSLLGSCYTHTGQFDTARPWFERAVTEAEQGDIHGRVDHESLGTSLHLVGDCYSSAGHFDQARACFERAVTEKEHGDIHGRVDHESLRRSRQALELVREKD